jgi:hypothetical protein
MTKVLNENQIEAIVERRMDSLDRQLMAGECSQDEYDHAADILSKWADEQYALIVSADEMIAELRAAMMEA